MMGKTREKKLEDDIQVLVDVYFEKTRTEPDITLMGYKVTVKNPNNL